MALRKTKKTARKRPDDAYTITGGWFGDHDRRTRDGIIQLGVLLGLVLMLFVGIGGFINGKWQYAQEMKNNTTPIGSELTFTRSGAKLTIADVWTDKNKDVTVVKLAYDETARNLLSTKGSNYRLFLFSDSGKPPVKAMEYGLLGTEGDGYLVIKGQLEHRAYQVYLLNELKLDLVGEAGEAPSSAAIDESMERSISRINGGDMNKSGIVDYGEVPPDKRPKYDSVNFRVNQFTQTTKVYDGSFLTSDGQIDYSKVVGVTSVDVVIKKLEKDIKASEDRILGLDASLKEFEDRLKENPDDLNAQSSADEIKKSIQDENGVMEQNQELLVKYQNADFDRSSFGDMQTKYKIIVK